MAGAGHGLWLLLGLAPGQLTAVLGWAIGGVVAHDGLLAPAVVAAGAAVARLAPTWRAALQWSVVILGPLTLSAVPVLGRFGAKPDNPTLLDRPYWLGYGLIVALVLAGSVAARGDTPAHAHPGRRTTTPGAVQGSTPVDHASRAGPSRLT